VTDVNEFSELVYGFKRHGPFNPSRDIIFPIAMQNDIVWDWLMLASAAHIASQGGNLPERVLNHRRSLVYGKLGRAINTPNQHASDALILSITATILVETRFGDPKSIIIHLQGMKACLDQRGSITSLVGKWWYPTVIQGLHIAGMGLPLSSVSGDWTIIPKIDNLSRILGLVQNVGIGYRHAARRESDSEHPSRWRIAVPAEYIAAREPAFSPAAPLHDILRASHLGFRSTSRVKQHCSLAVLLSLNIALWEYRTEPAAVKYYLETLVSRIRLNEAFLCNLCWRCSYSFSGTECYLWLVPVHTLVPLQDGKNRSCPLAWDYRRRYIPPPLGLVKVPLMGTRRWGQSCDSRITLLMTRPKDLWHHGQISEGQARCKPRKCSPGRTEGYWV
jgi:hypothetical protein